MPMDAKRPSGKVKGVRYTPAGDDSACPLAEPPHDDYHASAAQHGSCPESRTSFFPYVATGIVLTAFFALFYASNHERNRQQNSQIYSASQEAGQPTAQLQSDDNKINLTAFADYRKMRDAEYAELNSLAPIQASEIPVPSEIEAYYPDNMPKTFAIDLNEDGIDEVLLQEDNDVYDNCWSKILQRTDSGYVVILDARINSQSGKMTNSYKNMYAGNKVYLPGGGFTNTLTRYEWNGSEYAKSGTLWDPVNLPDVTDSLRTFLASGASASDVQSELRKLEASIGTDSALQAVISSQLAPNIPLPTGFQYDQLLLQLSKDRGVNYLGFADNPAGLRAALFGSTINSIVPNPADPRQLAVIAGVSVASSLLRSFSMDSRAQYIQSLRKVYGPLDNYMERTGKSPNDVSNETLSRMLRQGASFAIREDELPKSSVKDTSIYNVHQSPSGTVETRTFDALSVPGDPRYLNMKPQQKVQAQQNWQRAQQDMQKAQQAAAERARQMGNQAKKQLNNLLNPPKKK